MCVADGDVAGEPAPRRRRRVGESERGTETVAELLELHAAIRLRRPLLNNWDVVRGEWVPLLPFAMKIGSELYHPAHGGDERPRSGSYTRAVNGCFDPKCCEKKE